MGLADQKTPGEETLGLQIVRALATQDLGGRFDLESGGGTRVTITFPAPEAS